MDNNSSEVKSAMQILLRPLIMLRQRLLKLWLFCLLAAAVAFGSAIARQRPPMTPLRGPLLPSCPILHPPPCFICHHCCWAILWFSSCVICFSLYNHQHILTFHLPPFLFWPYRKGCKIQVMEFVCGGVVLSPFLKGEDNVVDGSEDFKKLLEFHYHLFHTAIL